MSPLSWMAMEDELKKMVEENQTNYSEILNKASESINSFITKAV